jgi:PAS domain S-box-containing protein
MIVMSDLTGRMTFVSSAARRAGWAPEDLVGRHSTDTMHPDDVPEVSRVVRPAAEGRAGKRVRWRGRDGQTGDGCGGNRAPRC